MDDANRMRFRETVERLKHVSDGFGDRKRLSLPELALEVAPLEVLEHDERRSFVLADVEHARYVLSAEARRRAGFARKARDDFRSPARFRTQKLDRDGAAQLHVRRCENDAEATLGHERIDPVPTGKRCTYEDGQFVVHRRVMPRRAP